MIKIFDLLVFWYTVKRNYHQDDKVAIHNVPFLHIFEYWADPAFLGLLLHLGKSGYVFKCQL